MAKYKGVVGKRFLQGSFAGIKIANLSLSQAAEVLVSLVSVKNSKPFFVTYLNAHNFNILFKNLQYKNALKKADIIYADGWSIVLATKIWGYKLPGRLTAYDFFYKFCSLCEQSGYSLFLLGGEKSVVKKTSQSLKTRFPNLDIKGYTHGFFSAEEKNEVIAKINKVKPDYLILNMGSPKQEIWLKENLTNLSIKVGWCVGGLFNYISGQTPRCPYWLGRFGLEWMYRLCVEPKRLWRRYLIGLPLFVYNLIRLRLRKLE